MEAVEGFKLYRMWWQDISSRKGEATVRQYRYFVFRTFADLPGDPLSITTKDLDAYLGNLRANSAKATRGALNDFFEFLVRRGWRSDNPLEKAKKIRVSKRRIKRGWSQEEVFRVFCAAIWLGRYGNRGTGWPLAWAIAAQYCFGLRPGELIKLRRSEVNLNGATSCIYIIETKTGNDRTIPVVEGLGRQALEQLLELSPNGNLVHIGRTQYWQQVKTAALLAGVSPERARPYALRHSFASHLVEKGVHIRVIAELLGHVDLRATMTYTTPGDEQMRDALRRLTG